MRVSQVARVVNNPPPNARDLREQFPSLGWEDSLEEGMATHSSILAWRIPWMEEPGGLSPVQFSCSVVSDSLQPHGLQYTRFPVHHQLLKLTQIHVHQVGDASQPLHPLSSTSPPNLNLSQHQGLKMSQSLYQVAKVLEFQLQHQSFQWTPRTDLLAVQGTLKESSPTPQLKSVNYSVLSFLYSPTLTSIHDYWENHSFN